MQCIRNFKFSVGSCAPSTCSNFSRSVKTKNATKWNVPSSLCQLRVVLLSSIDFRLFRTQFKAISVDSVWFIFFFFLSFLFFLSCEKSCLRRSVIDVAVVSLLEALDVCCLQSCSIYAYRCAKSGNLMFIARGRCTTIVCVSCGNLFPCYFTADWNIVGTIFIRCPGSFCRYSFHFHVFVVIVFVFSFFRS